MKQEGKFSYRDVKRIAFVRGAPWDGLQRNGRHNVPPTFESGVNFNYRR